jgi:hypothetical protein
MGNLAIISTTYDVGKDDFNQSDWRKNLIKT